MEETVTSAAELATDAVQNAVSGLSAINLQSLLNSVINGCVSIAWKLFVSLLVFFIGRALIDFALRLFPDGKRFSAMNPTAKNFLRNTIKAGLWLVLTVTIVGIMGIEMASVITVIASAGAAIALALQGSLSNLAGGVMILIFKPFELGDFIELDGNSGTVIDVGIFYTTLRTGDNRHVIIPNGSIMSASLINSSREKTRRLDIAFKVSAGTDVEKVKQIVLDLAAAHEKVLKEPAPFLRITEMADPTLTFTLRVWTNAGDFWGVKFDLLETLDKTFQKEGIEIPMQAIVVKSKN